MHSNILTRFGNIDLLRATYRRGRTGKVIAPVEKMLGIEDNATPAAADLVGRQIAATGSSQKRSIEFIADRTGAKIGNEKLRNISSGLFDSMEPHREECQMEQLQKWVEQAENNGKSVVLSISRDGVSLCIAPYGFYEMAAAATLSVFSEGNRLGTVYLSATPQENQTQLSENFTSLLSNVVRTCGEKISRIAYVTDAGKVETAYWKTTLRKFYVDGQYIKIDRTVDYYHANLRLTAIADSLKLDDKPRRDWLERTRKLLLLDGGWGRVMRSIAKMKELHGLKASAADEFGKAEKYLRRYRRFMNYAEQRGQRGLFQLSRCIHPIKICHFRTVVRLVPMVLVSSLRQHISSPVPLNIRIEPLRYGTTLILRDAFTAKLAGTPNTFAGHNPYLYCAIGEPSLAAFA